MPLSVTAAVNCNKPERWYKAVLMRAFQRRQGLIRDGSRARTVAAMQIQDHGKLRDVSRSGWVVEDDFDIRTPIGRVYSCPLSHSTPPNSGIVGSGRAG